MSATIVSLGMIAQTKNERSVAEFQRLADEAGLKDDESGEKLKVVTLLPQLQPLFLDYNLGKFSPEEFIEAFHKILPVPKDAIKAAWNAMCIVDDEALETLALIQATNEGKEEVEQIYIYSDTNPMHLEKILSEVSSRKSTIGKITVFTTFEHGVPKEKLLGVVVNKAKEDGCKDYTLIIGTNVIEQKQLKERATARDEAIIKAAQALEVRVESVSSPRLSPSVLKEYLQKSAASKKSSMMAETPLSTVSDQILGLTLGLTEAYSGAPMSGSGQEVEGSLMLTSYETRKQQQGGLNPSSAASQESIVSSTLSSTASSTMSSTSSTAPQKVTGLKNG